VWLCMAHIAPCRYSSLACAYNTGSWPGPIPGGSIQSLSGLPIPGMGPNASILGLPGLFHVLWNAGWFGPMRLPLRPLSVAGTSSVAISRRGPGPGRGACMSMSPTLH
jgi:hypothetical protein